MLLSLSAQFPYLSVMVEIEASRPEDDVSKNTNTTTAHCDTGSIFHFDDQSLKRVWKGGGGIKFVGKEMFF